MSKKWWKMTILATFRNRLYYSCLFTCSTMILLPGCLLWMYWIIARTMEPSISAAVAPLMALLFFLRCQIIMTRGGWIRFHGSAPNGDCERPRWPMMVDLDACQPAAWMEPDNGGAQKDIHHSHSLTEISQDQVADPSRMRRRPVFGA